MNWIDRGLRFRCTGCGACCHQSGYVWVTVPEIERLARARDESLQEFGRRFLVRIGSRYSIGEDSLGRCLLLGEDNRCTVYADRPQQCRSFPFWKRNLESPETWSEAAELSPGIGHGRLYSREEIDRIASGRAAAEETGNHEPG